MVVEAVDFPVSSLQHAEVKARAQAGDSFFTVDSKKLEDGCRGSTREPF